MVTNIKKISDDNIFTSSNKKSCAMHGTTRAQYSFEKQTKINLNVPLSEDIKRYVSFAIHGR